MASGSRLSPTTLNLFLECPRCFWLQFIHGIKRPRGPLPTILNGLDRIVKAYCSGYRARGEIPPLLAGKLPSGRLIPELPEWLTFEDDDGARLVGKLDECLILQDGRHAPVDHKSRGSPPMKVHPANQFQMDAYGFLLQANGYPAADVAFLAYYFPLDVTDGRFTFDVAVTEVKTDRQRAHRVFREALALLRAPSEPEASSACALCTYVAATRSP